MIGRRCALVRPGEVSQGTTGVTYAAGVSATTTGGEIVLWFGDRLEEKVVARAGDFLYIPNGVPQLPVNGNATESAVAVLARTDASHLRGTAVR